MPSCPRAGAVNIDGEDVVTLKNREGGGGDVNKVGLGSQAKRTC